MKKIFIKKIAIIICAMILGIAQFININHYVAMAQSKSDTATSANTIELIQDNQLNKSTENQVGMKILLDLDQYKNLSKENQSLIKEKISNLIKAQNTICFISDSKNGLSWEYCSELIADEQPFQIAGQDKIGKTTEKKVKVILFSQLEDGKQIVEFCYDMSKNYSDGRAMLDTIHEGDTAYNYYTETKDANSRFIILNAFDYGKYGVFHSSVDLKKIETSGTTAFWVINGYDTLEMKKTKYQADKVKTRYQMLDPTKEIICDYNPTTESRSSMETESVDNGNKTLNWKIDYSNFNIIDQSNPSEGNCSWEVNVIGTSENLKNSLTWTPAMVISCQSTNPKFTCSYEITVEKSFLGIAYEKENKETGTISIKLGE